MANASKVKEHMQVFGSCGNLLGTVDRVESDLIKLTAAEGGQHHFIPLNWIDSVDDSVRLTRDCGTARREWRPETFPV